MKSRLWFILCLAGAGIAGEPTAESVPEDRGAFRAVIGLQSNVSDGDRPVAELAAEAAAAGVDAVFLTDQLYRGLHYGVWPLRYSLWLTLQRPSLMTYGVDRYLNQVAELNRQQSDVLLIPGARLVPRYYWTGGLWEGLTCHNSHRHLDVLGCRDRSVYSDLNYAAGYVPGRDTLWGLTSRLLLFLVITLMVGFFFLPSWLRHYFRVRRRKTKGIYFVFILTPVCVLLVFFNLLSADDGRFQIYGETVGVDVEQRLLDELNRSGQVQYWAHPQSLTEGFGWPVSYSTEPYANVINLTHGYDAFSCFSEGESELYKAGSIWDEKLMDYANQVVPYPAWALGELPPSYRRKSWRMDVIENVILAPQRSEAALLHAIAEGQFYPRRRTATNAISIDRFAVEGRGFGGQVSTSKRRVDLALDVSSLESGTPVSIDIIRNGQNIYTFKETTPVQKAFADPLDRQVERFYYRVIVEGPGGVCAVGQPVFVTYSQPLNQPGPDTLF